MTISDTTVDLHYDDPAGAWDAIWRPPSIAKCSHSPTPAACTFRSTSRLFARKPDAALEYGFENLERAFHGCPEHVTRTVHMCCGYPDRLDRPDYPKADPGSYFRLADAVEDAAIDAISIEDAHRPNDLSLLERFRSTTVVLGVVAIAKSRIESPGEIVARLDAALHHIDAHRLVAAPDCGLGLLSRDLARSKLANMCQAARATEDRISRL